jgi:hypothetical protein
MNVRIECSNWEYVRLIFVGLMMRFFMVVCCGAFDFPVSDLNASFLSASAMVG